ncbi:MAG: IPT/TIG domain-containing protein, partial [Blastocatellia bacterium]|nr:IPT/TIG domain-containing protein [Blastocatellia bacterium]
TIANTGGMAALNSVTNRIYLDFGQVIDGNTNQVVPSQLFIAFPSVVGVNAQSRKIYLAKFDGIEVYDAVTEQLLTTIPRNLTPRDIAVDQVLNRVSVLDANGLLVIDGNRDVVIHSSAFSNGPSAKLDVNDNTHRLYLADGAGILKILDGNVYQVIQTLVYDPATGSSFNHLQVDSATSRLFLINTAGGSVFVIDDALPFTREPQIFAADPVFGPAGTVVTISGANLNTVTRVTFNGKPALFRIDSASQITATVPAGATTGPVVVTATNGAATGPVFTVVRTK